MTSRFSNVDQAAAEARTARDARVRNYQDQLVRYDNTGVLPPALVSAAPAAPASSGAETVLVASIAYKDPSDADATWSGVNANSIGIFDALPPAMDFVVHDESYSFGFDDFQFTYGILVDTPGIFELQVYMECRDPVAGGTLDTSSLGNRDGSLTLYAYSGVVDPRAFVGTSAVVTPRTAAGLGTQVGASLRAYVDPAIWVLNADPDSTRNVVFEFTQHVSSQPITIHTLLVNVLWTPHSAS